jgi:hypothetical protein
MRKTNKKENKDKRFGETDLEGPFRVNSIILAKNKSNPQSDGEWRDAKIISLKLSNTST